MQNKVDNYWNSPEFIDLYKNKISPILMKHEPYRKRAFLRRTSMIVLIIILCLLAVSVFPLISYFKITDVVLVSILLASVFLILMCAIILRLQMHGFSKNYIVSLKSACLDDILKFFGDIFWTHNARNISDEELNASGLFADFNRREVDDSFEGTYKDVNYKICETTLLFEHSCGKSGRSQFQVFKGVVFSFDLNKTLKNKTVIFSKWDLTAKDSYLLYLSIFLLCVPVIIITIFHNIFACLYYLFVSILLIAIAYSQVRRKQETTLTMDKVNLEDPMFSKNFNVYSSDQVEARCLVTPIFIEKFQKLETAFGASKTKCAFYDNKMIMAIHTNKNLFEIGKLDKSLDNIETISNFYKELSSIQEMIDYFKLYEQILS